MEENPDAAIDQETLEAAKRLEKHIDGDEYEEVMTLIQVIKDLAQGDSG